MLQCFIAILGYPKLRMADHKRRNNKHALILARETNPNTLEVNSFVPAWTTFAADWAADAATIDNLPNPCITSPHKQVDHQSFNHFYPHKKKKNSSKIPVTQQREHPVANYYSFA
jgi:hypothetical protein